MTVQFPEFDIAVIGEGEITVCEVASALEDKGDLANVAGIVFKDRHELVRTPPRGYIADLDTIAFPSWHLLPVNKYNDILAGTNKFATMITSRGCPFSCIFCSAECRMGRRFRFRSPENVLEEIELLTSNFGIEEVCFYDDTFTASRERVERLCDEMVRRRTNIRWECRTRVDLVDDELLGQMASAGCYRIRYGIESGDDGILENLNKRITVAQIEDAVAKTRRHNIEAFGYFMLGCPGETPETVAKTLDLSRRLGLDYANFNVMSIRPPGSELFRWAIEHGHIESDYWERFTMGEELNPSPPLITDVLGSDDLKRFERKAYVGFYFSPRYLLRGATSRHRRRIAARIASSFLSVLRKPSS